MQCYYKWQLRTAWDAWCTPPPWGITVDWFQCEMYTNRIANYGVSWNESGNLRKFRERLRPDPITLAAFDGELSRLLGDIELMRIN